MTDQSQHPPGDVELVHDLITVSELWKPGEFVAACSCGWESRPTRDEAAGLDAWDMHCDAVFEEASAAW